MNNDPIPTITADRIQKRKRHKKFRSVRTICVESDEPMTKTQATKEVVLYLRGVHGGHRWQPIVSMFAGGGERYRHTINVYCHYQID